MVQSGLDRFMTDGLPGCVGRRVGLMCHGASVDSRLRYVFDLFAGAGIDLKFILAPEHGIFGEIPYMQAVDDFRLEPVGVPVVSLYKDSDEQLRPPPGLLESIDVLVCDIQDVGSRYYTYIATMAMLLEACSGTALKFIVLDRPNPIGLDTIEGNVRADAVRSFVGYMPIANRHGLTVGEAAMMYRDLARLDVDLSVVACGGLNRAMMWNDTGLPFVPPSPNIPDAATALVYTGMCLLEGTNLSEGRGTASPFMFAGAPWITDPWAFVDRLNRFNLDGVAFRPVRFTPAFDKHCGRSCGGLHMVVTDPGRFQSLLTGMTIVGTAASMFPADFRLRADAYEFVHDIPALDLLLGDTTSAAALLGGHDPRDVYATFENARAGYILAAEPYRLYPAETTGA